MIIALLACTGYLYATRLIHLRHGTAHHSNDRRLVIFVVMTVTFLLHVTLISRDFSGLMHNVSVMNILTLVALCMTVVGAVRYIFYGDRIAYPVVALIAAVSLWLPIVFPAPATIAHGWALKVHIVLSVSAYIALSFAALYAVFLLLKDYRLRHGSHDFERATPLKEIERTMISFTRFGGILLTLSLATGILFIHDIWRQHVAHKLFFGATSWIIIAIVLIRHHLRGFRGRPAALWLLSGFFCLVLAYFGTAFVLQIILKR